jgi:hypothetical protein
LAWENTELSVQKGALDMEVLWDSWATSQVHTTSVMQPGEQLGALTRVGSWSAGLFADHKGWKYLFHPPTHKISTA